MTLSSAARAVAISDRVILPQAKKKDGDYPSFLVLLFYLTKKLRS